MPSVICDDDDQFQGWMVGNLTENKCDAILCPIGTFSAVGRQTDVKVPCQKCPGETEELRAQQAPYYGSLKCNAISEERLILEKIFNLVFTPSSENKYWMTDNPICTWYGVTCNDDFEDKGVIEINLESNSLGVDNLEDLDAVSKLFFELPSLKMLNVRGNKVPLKMDYIRNAKNLTLLQLSATGLTSIQGIGQATKLKELHVTENKLKGDFPDELFDLPNLEKLYISFNNIDGTLPTQIGTLTKLKELYAYTNSMTGTIPTELGNLVQLEYLVLGQNKFRGTLPTQLNNLVNLKELSFYYQEGTEGGLSGKLLDFSMLTHLENLDVEGLLFRNVRFFLLH